MFFSYCSLLLHAKGANQCQKKGKKKGRKWGNTMKWKGGALTSGRTHFKSFFHRSSAFATPSTLQGTQSLHYGSSSQGMLETHNQNIT